MHLGKTRNQIEQFICIYARIFLYVISVSLSKGFVNPIIQVFPSTRDPRNSDVLMQKGVRIFLRLSFFHRFPLPFFPLDIPSTAARTARLKSRTTYSRMTANSCVRRFDRHERGGRRLIRLSPIYVVLNNYDGE